MPMLMAKDTPGLLRKGGSARVALEVPARFAPGDRVAVRNLNPLGHTRAPRYIRCKIGTIDCDHGVFVFPDTHAHGKGPKPQHVYSVRFTARDVWGPDASAHDAIYIDLWDDYLDPVAEQTS
jgi:nitrile hydratase subunit beta